MAKTEINRIAASTYPGSESALELIREQGYITMEDACHRLFESMWQSAPVPEPVKDIRQKGGSRNSLTIRQRRDATKSVIERALMAGVIKLFSWPAEVDEFLELRISAKKTDPILLSIDLLRKLIPLHGGIPIHTLLIRPSMITKEMIASGNVPFPEYVPVLETEQFLKFLGRERKKGNWASQQRASRKRQRSGAPNKSRSVELLIVNLMDRNRWTNAASVLRLHQLVIEQRSANGESSVSWDTVKKALTNLARETGETRFQKSMTYRQGLRSPGTNRLCRATLALGKEGRKFIL